MTIGGFDGVHRGHQFLLQKLQQRARDRHLTDTVVTFDPLPKKFFAPHADFLEITPLSRKLLILDSLGISQVVVLPFTSTLAKTSATDFVEALHQNLYLSYLLIGNDFVFGHQRQGDIHFLQHKSQEYKFELDICSKVADDHNPISASRIRNLIRKYQWTQVNQLLGWDYRNQFPANT
jgi:riboflavin kinase/FMN adenylyltransferase